MGGLSGKAGMLGSILKKVGGMLPWLGRGLLFIGRALLLNPIGLAITAIAGGAYLIYKNWDKLVNWWNTTSWQEKTLTLIPTPLKLAWELAQAVWNWWNGNEIKEKDMPITTGILKAAYDLAKTALNWWNSTELVSKALDLSTESLQAAWNLAKDFASWWGNLVLKSLVPDIKWPEMPSWMPNFGKSKSIIKASQQATDQLPTAAAEAPSSARDSEGQPAKRAGGLFGIAQSVGSAIFGGNRATGGAVSNDHFYRVNEQGPELFNSNGSTYLMMGKANGFITPLTQSAANDNTISNLSRDNTQAGNSTNSTLNANDTTNSRAQSNINGDSSRISNVVPIASRQAKAAPAGNTISQQITITINPSPGMKEQDIAAAVAKQLADQKREAEQQHQARYYD